MNPHSLKAFHFGVSLARQYDAKLHVLHLVTDPVDMMVLNSSGLFPEVMYTNYFDNQQDAKERLDMVIKKETDEGFPINELVSDNDSVEEILKVVSDEKIDLIVMLAHEEGRLEHALFGGENDAIVRRMPCSILLLKEELEPGNATLHREVPE
jgi:nucleotide-binding universal stress UspA family protein